jgi:hypothetical protein
MYWGDREFKYATEADWVLITCDQKPEEIIKKYGKNIEIIDDFLIWGFH